MGSKTKLKRAEIRILTVIFYIILFASIVALCSCCYSIEKLADRLEGPYYRKFYLTEAVKIDSIVGGKVYVSDFLPGHNAYSIEEFDGEVFDTVYFRDYRID